ncbi:MAG: endonuclease domain-containing protein [Candidatus Kerfeldbacteria bacterium]|nr:endonuclease domain-containing protein [Candidatus Kerfeldbacteria bacterium]
MLRLFNPLSTKELRQQLRRQPSRAETVLWGVLRAHRFHGLKFRRQHGFGPYVVDFYCPKKRLVIEVDGDSHFSPTERQHDETRTIFLARLGPTVIRVRNDEATQDLNEVLQRLESLLDLPTTPTPSSSEEGRV